MDWHVPTFVASLVAVVAATLGGAADAEAQAAAENTAAETPASQPRAATVPAFTLPATSASAATSADPSRTLSHPELAARLTPALRELRDVRAVRYAETEPDVLRIVSYREFQLYLPRIAARVAAAPEPVEDVLAEVVTQTAASMAASNPFKIEALRVVIRPTGAVDSFEQLTGVDGVANKVVRRVFSPGLDEVLVADTGTTLAFVPESQLTHLQLGETDAFSWGRTNTEVLAREVRFEEEDGIRIAVLDGNMETSLLAVDRLWTQLAADMGGAIAVAAPTRNRLLVARAGDARAMARLRRMAEAEAVGEQALFDGVLLRQGRNWVAR